MDEELLGFVASSGWRRRVLRSLDRHGESSLSELASREHLPEKAVGKALEGSEQRGLVESGEDSFRLTEKGSRLVARLGDLEG